MIEAIRGKIAAIIDESSVLVNVGTRNGVSEGMVFVVFEEADEIKDPDSGEVIGRWEIVKGHLVAVHVQEALSTCEGVDPGKSGAELSAAGSHTLSAKMILDSMPHLARAGAAKLDVRKDQMTGRRRAGPIALGDLVRSLGGIAPPISPREA